jgi:hypothetical protein
VSAEIRNNPDTRFLIINPFPISETEVMDDMSGMQKIMFKYTIMSVVMPLKGMVHGLEVIALGKPDDDYGPGQYKALPHYGYNIGH